MIDKQKIKLCAENIVKCINMQKEGECIFVKGGVYSQDLLEEIGLEVYRKGGIPQISSVSDNFREQMFFDEQIKTSTLERTPKHYLKLIENIDGYIVIEPDEDPSILNKVPRERLKAYTKSVAPIKNVLYGYNEKFAPGKKWCYAGWPSKKAANFFKVDYDLLEKFIIGGISVPMERLHEITVNLGKFFKSAKKVYVTDDLGSDFWISIERRNRTLDDGHISDEQIEAGDLGSNLPAGEVFFPPNEKQGEGTIFCPVTQEKYSNEILKNVTLEFKDGKLLIDKVSADDKVDVLISSFKECEEIDKMNQVEELMTYNIAELGIGCNPEITKAIGYILTDEKIIGSVHLAFGGNKSMGGNSSSQMHWDFVTTPKVNLTVEYLDGIKRPIMENGKLIDN